jgi:hypothetical protein
MNLDASIAIRLQPRFVTFVFALILLPTIAIGAPKCGPQLTKTLRESLRECPRTGINTAPYERLAER